MESSSPHTGAAVLKQTSARRPLSSIQLQDLWSATRNGSIVDLELALLALKKNGGNIDARDMFGSTALHIAVWRNHVPVVRRLLAAGADPNARDGESGWSSLHRALHFGHLAVAGVLIEAGASLTLEDSKARTPVDMVSGPVQLVFEESNEGITELFSWGNGANYQLGTGNARIQRLPCKVEALQGLLVKAIATAKFHSVAVTALGELYTWGYGRGGRLGHPDFDIHSGQAAVITPRRVINGLGQRRVKVIAAAKHHTIVATEGGEVFTWGSNREGQLGYPAVDTQPTPRRVSSLKARVTALAAANKHSAVVTEAGEVYSWGCNREGQLGYGTSNSASNYVPRSVESLKGKCFVAVSAAKCHTVVLGSDGEVFTWGYKMVSPKRVTIVRNTKKSGNIPLKFHRMERLHVVSIAAGMTHSTALSDDGSLFYWVSSDPNLRCQQLYSMTSNSVVSVSSSKYWTAIVTSKGDIYGWDGKKSKEEPPIPQRVHGVKHATSVSVGENHFLAVSAVYIPKYPPKHIGEIEMQMQEHCEEADDIEDDDMTLNECHDDAKDGESGNENVEKRVPSLKDLCQKVAAEYLVEPKNAVQLLEVADTLEAEDLRMHCEDLVVRNLDYILTISPVALANVSSELLAKLEKSLDSKSSEPWSYRCLPTPTATFPAVIDSEEDDASRLLRLRNIASPEITDQTTGERRSGDGFLQQTSEADQAVAKQVRAIKKKLQQIEMLEMKQRNGDSLDHQQQSKLHTKISLENALFHLESGVAVEPNEEMKSASSKAELLDGKSAQKGSRNRRHKGKKKGSKFSQEEVEDFPETSMSEMLIKAGPKKKQDELHSLNGFEDDNCLYNGQEDDCTQFRDQNISSILQKGNLATYISHYSNKISSMETFSNNDSELKVAQKNNQSLQKSLKKKSKKGGLSLFLNGALDAPKVSEPAPTPPKVEGPAWGGAKIKKGSMSLLEIQNEQIVESNIPLTPEDSRSALKNVSKDKHPEYKTMRRSRGLAEAYETDIDELEADRIQIPINQLLRQSAPIAVAKGKKTCASDLEKNTPPWAGTSPLMSRSSLREIQMQQVKQRQNMSRSLKDKNLTTVGCSSSMLDLSLNVANDSPNCWFKPEVNTPSSIRCIQIEEKAMKELGRFYKNVKLVKDSP